MKRIAFLLPVFVLIFISACQKNSYDIYAYSDIEKYTMSMSSSPGLPISIQISGDDYDNFTVTCKTGSVFVWNDRAGSPINKGDRLSFDKKMTKVYWSPDEGQKADSNILIAVYRNDRVVYEKKYAIKYLGDQFFSFQGDN